MSIAGGWVTCLLSKGSQARVVLGLVSGDGAQGNPVQ